ncbi:cysteine desulfurase [[Haemophilus] ducreyi]|uniref:cysteine desulfurase n=2 Tax=Haemophilus ducreyi TaxID=730 RepID=Q7VNM8_HAEDU|nr:cysteine desulfurase [[Haemophilus] ducreyi]AAP95424.1 putative aminotransferase [[Haemophilus] ducreyi 35000HP]AKO30530.1 cysteine desulfurase [[Haemophilus] ducreyi]AKO31965.1 cysteine desulfurase [[Haemophilus] ducreyi]AKO33420.1 cysteine desulfurase [[Haemophilus] ducreyi]AKO34867.1 cysteine desulfurase [[Haemophilus] ducreyi]
MNEQLVDGFRQQFPFFTQYAEWSYLDSAATTLKPAVLIEAMSDFYASAGSVHRSQYDLAQTQDYELARQLVVKWFNVESAEGVIWTSGTTHSTNLVASGLAYSLNACDEIIISIAEHHANFIPWQQLAMQTQAKLIILPVSANLELTVEQLKQVLSTKTKIVALNLVSNVTGIRQPVESLIPIIRQYSSAKILLDCAQAVCSESIDVQRLGADFYTFSAHKMYGPTGVGVLMGKVQSLAQIRPLFFGGKMLSDVSIDHLELAELPYRLEAGTPNIAGIIGFGKVLQWLAKWDMDTLNQAVKQLSIQAYQRLTGYSNIRLFCDKPTTIISFAVDRIHHADIAAIMAESKVAIRSGEHCAKPYLAHLNQPGTLRISLAPYNQAQDLNRLFEALEVAFTLLAD